MINWKLKSQNQLPIGLDIGHHSIKMIQLAVNDGHISVLAASKVRIDASINGDVEERSRFVISAIKQMLSEGNFRGKNVVSCLPDDKLRITSVRLGEGETEEIEQVLRKEASERFGLDADKDVINYMPAGSIRQGDEIKDELILFAVDNETIKRQIEMLEQAQLRPVAIDAGPCALFRSFERSLRRQEDKNCTTIFVDAGRRTTTVVFGCGGDITFVKQIPIGGEEFDRRIAAKLGIGIDEAGILRGKLRTEVKSPVSHGTEKDTWTREQGAATDDSLDVSTRQIIVDTVGSVAEELAREISLCIRYYTVTFRGKRVERAVFAGGEAYENIMLEVLRRQLTVEIEVAQPLRGFDMMSVNFDSDRRGLLCEWAVAVGLGFKGLNEAAEKSGEYERN